MIQPTIVINFYIMTQAYKFDLMVALELELDFGDKDEAQDMSLKRTCMTKGPGAAVKMQRRDQELSDWTGNVYAIFCFRERLGWLHK
jgi:hypothetical protein